MKTLDVLRSSFGYVDIATQEELAEADVIIGHSLGSLTFEGTINAQLAQTVINLGGGSELPVVADRTLADAFPDGGKSLVDCVAEGDRSNSVGQGLGTWGTLKAARTYMWANGLERAIMVGQRNHVGRTVMQGNVLGINSVIPPNLPEGFQPDDPEQPWVRNLGLFVVRENVGGLVLRAQGRL